MSQQLYRCPICGSDMEMQQTCVSYNFVEAVTIEVDGYGRKWLVPSETFPVYHDGETEDVLLCASGHTEAEMLHHMDANKEVAGA